MSSLELNSAIDSIQIAISETEHHCGLRYASTFFELTRICNSAELRNRAFAYIAFFTPNIV